MPQFMQPQKPKFQQPNMNFSAAEMAFGPRPTDENDVAIQAQTAQMQADDRKRRGVPVPTETAEGVANMPNEHQPTTGDQVHSNGASGAKGSFEEMSGMVPRQIQPTSVQNQYIEDYDKNIDATNDAYVRMKEASTTPASGMRKFAGALGGIGMGMLSANPMAGFGVYKAITQHPAQVGMQSAQQDINRLGVEREGYEKVAGFQNDFMGRATGAQTAENQRAAGALDVSQEQHKRAFPKLNAPTNINGQMVQTEENAGTVPGGQINRGAAPLDASQLKEGPDGVLHAIGRDNIEKPVVNSKGEPLVVDMNDQEFDTWFSAYQAGDEAEMKAIEGYRKAGASNFGPGNAEIAKAVTDTDATNVQAVVSGIRANLEKITDPNEYNRTMEEYLSKTSALPGWAAVAANARAELLKTKPAAPKAGSGRAPLAGRVQ